jgi:hypothetical protein
MKCSACRDDNWKKTCKREYEYRSHCRGIKEGIKCSCVCQESVGDAILEKGVPIVLGVAGVAGKYNLKSFKILKKFNHISTN